MVAILTTAPQAEPVTREEAKAHARIDGSSEDQHIDALIVAARTEVENRTSRALMTQNWRIVRDGVPRGGVVRIAPAPLISVDQVTVYDADGAPETVPQDDYQVDLISSPGRLKLRAGRCWSSRAMNGLEIDFTCGYGAREAVPAPIKHSILMLIAYWFEQREAAAAGAVAGPVANGVSALLAPYRMPRIS
ncbi:MAG: head-tail connector protein [Pseudomonadota bacterium]